MAEFKCNECGKDFTSKDALDMHNNSKHFKAPKVPINKKKIKTWTIFIVILFVIVGVAYYMASNSSNGDGKYDEFAKCLSENNATMFGAYWCPHCKDQKKLFGNSWQYVNYVECSLPNAAGTTEECIKEGIDGYPTWDFSGEKVSRVMTLQELSSKTNCSLG